MTKNQIDYFSAKENVRHNKATEQETHRNNVAVLAETNRHNVVNEHHDYETRQEVQRHNFETEKIAKLQVENQQYANDTQRQHYERMDAETNRSNLANEDIKRIVQKEVERSNRANESIGWAGYTNALMNAQSNRINADSNKLNAVTNRMRAETEQANAVINDFNAQTNRSRVDTQNIIDQRRVDIEQRESTADVALAYQRANTERVKQSTEYINATANIMRAGSQVIAVIGDLLPSINFTAKYAR